MQEVQVRALGRTDLLEEEPAAHFGLLAWGIPRVGEPGGLQSVGSHGELGTAEPAHGSEFEEKCPFPIEWPWHPCQRSLDHICEGGNQTLLEKAVTH